MQQKHLSQGAESSEVTLSWQMNLESKIVNGVSVRHSAIERVNLLFDIGGLSGADILAVTPFRNGESRPEGP